MVQKTIVPLDTQTPAFAMINERERLEKSVFSNLSHDLKTPLACIIGALEIYERMDEKLTYEKKRVLINTALQEAYKLNDVLSEMLDKAAQ